MVLAATQGLLVEVSEVPPVEGEQTPVLRGGEPEQSLVGHAQPQRLRRSEHVEAPAAEPDRNSGMNVFVEQQAGMVDGHSSRTAAPSGGVSASRSNDSISALWSK